MRATCCVRSRSTSACATVQVCHPANRAAKQIRQRQARGARLGVPPGTLRLAGADLHPHGASGTHDAPLAMWGSEGAQPPASSLRGRAKRGHGGYAGSPPKQASDNPVGGVSESHRRPPLTRWRSTPANTPGTPFTGPRKARPSARDARAATDPRQHPSRGARASVRRGMDQPELRVSSRVLVSSGGATFHPSVTRRAISYGFHPRLVSIQPERRRAVLRLPVRPAMSGALSRYRSRDRLRRMRPGGSPSATGGPSGKWLRRFRGRAPTDPARWTGSPLLRYPPTKRDLLGPPSRWGVTLKRPSKSPTRRDVMLDHARFVASIAVEDSL